MSIDRTPEVFDEVSRSGYYPEIVADGLRDALADESVLAYVLHHEPTFDRDEIRRHMTVLALTPGRVVLVHTDEHPPDDCCPARTRPPRARRCLSRRCARSWSPAWSRRRPSSSKRSSSRSGGARSRASTSSRRPATTPSARPTTATPATSPATTSRCASALRPTAARPCGDSSTSPDPVRSHHPGHHGRPRLMAHIRWHSLGDRGPAASSYGPRGRHTLDELLPSVARRARRAGLHRRRSGCPRRRASW